MTTIEEKIHDALTLYLRRIGFECDGVTGFEDVTKYGGYCDTCSYSETLCEVTYEYLGKTKTYEYYGTFANLIKELTE